MTLLLPSYCHFWDGKIQISRKRGHCGTQPIKEEDYTSRGKNYTSLIDCVPWCPLVLLILPFPKEGNLMKKFGKLA